MLWTFYLARGEEITDLVQYGEMTMQSFFRISKEFYDTALSYLEAWNKHNEDLY
jgi:hypothetical protein